MKDSDIQSTNLLVVQESASCGPEGKKGVAKQANLCDVFE